MPYANNKGADQPAHSHILISTFVVRCYVYLLYPKFQDSRLASVAEQNRLNPTCLKTPEDTFLQDVAH